MTEAKMILVDGEFIMAPEAGTVTEEMVTRSSHIAGHDVVTTQEAVNAKGLREIADLNWEPLDRPIFTQDGLAIPGHKAIVRSDTLAAIGVVGEGYEAVRNEEMFDLADAIIGESDTFKRAQAGILRGGKRTFLQISGGKRELNGMEVERFASLFNAFDGSLNFIAGFSNIFAVCSNTYAMAMRQAKSGLKLAHRAGVNLKIQNARKVLEAATEYHNEFDAEVLSLAAKPFTDLQMGQLAHLLLPGDSTRAQNSRQELVAAWHSAPGQNRGTRFGAMQAATYYGSNLVGIRSTEGRSDAEARRESTWWGTGAKVSEAAWWTLTDESAVQELAKQTVTVRLA